MQSRKISFWTQHFLCLCVLQQIRKFIKAEGNKRREGRRIHKQQENVLEILCFVAAENVKVMSCISLWQIKFILLQVKICCNCQSKSHTSSSIGR